MVRPEDDLGNLIITVDRDGRQNDGRNAFDLLMPDGRRVEISLLGLRTCGRLDVAIRAPRDVAILRKRAVRRQQRVSSSGSPRPRPAA